METIYIDVYFLINFTVDLLALYFAGEFTKIPIFTPRLLLSAFIGAAYAVFGVLFLDNSWIMYLLSVIIIILSCAVCSGKVSLHRKAKFLIAFLLCEIVMGGLVYYAYCFLDKYFDSSEFVTSDEGNRKFLIISIILLFSLGALKFLISTVAGMRGIQSAKLSVVFAGRESVLEAFVDSGNFALDPFDRTPVMLVTSKKAEEIFGFSFKREDFTQNSKMKNRIRIIPLSFGSEKKILYGVKPDFVKVSTKKKSENISLIIAIDKEGAGYNGYSALIPLSALENIKYETV